MPAVLPGTHPMPQRRTCSHPRESHLSYLRAPAEMVMETEMETENARLASYLPRMPYPMPYRRESLRADMCLPQVDESRHRGHGDPYERRCAAAAPLRPPVSSRSATRRH